MNTKNLHGVLRNFFQEASRTLVPFVCGMPGIGKTALMAQVAKEVGKRFIAMALPTYEAIDIRGLPHIIGGQTVWASPLPRSEENIILFFDEVTSAPQDVQAAVHNLVQAEEGSDLSLPSSWHVALAGNRAVDRSFYRAATGPLRNRVVMLELEATLEPWADWAIATGISPAIVGFLRWRPELLVAKQVPAEGAFNSPRAWVIVNKLIQLAQDAQVEAELIAGAVGEGPAKEFTAYLRTVRGLPSIERMFSFPREAKVPTEPSLLYATVTALAAETRVSQRLAMEYAARLPAEFALLYIVDVRDHAPALRNDPNFRKWVKQHAALFAHEVSA